MQLQPRFAACAAAILKPRYHFAGSEGVAWERDAYVCSGALHCTHFVAMCAASSSSSEDFLHELSIAPLSTLAEKKLKQMQANTESATRDPFTATSIDVESGEIPVRPVPRSVLASTLNATGQSRVTLSLW